MDQHAGVVGLRLTKDRLGWPLFDYAAVLHDDDAVGYLGDHSEVVGDEQHPYRGAAAAPRISLRICACVVTSSAVVGSSAIRDGVER